MRGKKAESNKVTKGGMMPVEALRIQNNHLKAKNKGLEKEIENARQQVNGVRAIKHELELLRRVTEEYGLCNPDIQIARMSVREADQRYWAGLSGDGVAMGGIAKSVWEEMMADDKERERAILIINQAKEKQNETK